MGTPARSKTLTWRELFAVIKGEKGTTEHPHGSNRTKYWAALIRWKLAAAYFQGQYWCAAFIVWCIKKAGGVLLPVTNPYYCPNLVQYARAHGLWNTSGQYKPGDMVFFAFTASAQASGLAEHIGWVVSDDGVTIKTYEGNTSSGDAGSQDNGGGVYPRSRPHGPMVLGVLEYHKLLSRPQAAPKHRVRRNPFLAALRNADLPIRQGDRGDEVRGLQWAVGCPVDGVFGPATEHALRHFQRYHNDRKGHRLIPDGEAGRLTLWALCQVTHFEHS